MYRNLVGTFCLLIVAGLLLGSGNVAFADQEDIAAAGETVKEQVKSDMEALWGESGTYNWLVQGTAGPEGNPDQTSSVTFTNRNSTVDATTYISVENADEAVLLGSSVESFETLGYVRNVDTKGSGEGNSTGTGIKAKKELLATTGQDEEFGLKVINNGAIYSQGQSAENAWINGMALKTDMASTNGSTLHAMNEMINEGSIYARATGEDQAWPSGMYSEMSGNNTDGGGTLSAINSLTNTGTIYGQATGDNALVDAVCASTYLHAVTEERVSAMNDVTNEGTIYAQTDGISGPNAWTDALASDAVAEATGGGNATAFSFMLNRGILYAEENEEYATVYGTYSSLEAIAQGGGKASVMDMERNTGSIYVEANGVRANAMGMYSEINAASDNGGDISVLAMLKNDGVIHAVTEGDFAIAAGMGLGMSSNATGDGDTTITNSITNTGTIYVSASGEQAAAVGITVRADVNVPDNGNATIRTEIINTGKIKTETTGTVERSYGILVSGDSTISNTGCMCVEGTGSAGIMILNGDTTISNTGFIHATNGARALYLASPGSAELSGENFQLVFSGNPADDSYAAPIYLATGATLDLNRVTLVATTGDTVTWDSPYSIIENNGGEVENTFGDLRLGVANPNVNVVWSGTDNSENAAVSFTYTPAESTAAIAPVATQQAVAGTIGMVQNRMSSMTLASIADPEADISDLLFADSGTIASDAGYGTTRVGDDPRQALFIKPYLTVTNMPSDGGMGYDAATTGFIAGYDRIVSPALLLGIHGGVARGDIDFTGTGYSDNSDDLDIYSLGLHGTYTCGNWHVQASTSGYAARHDYEGLTGLNLDIDEDDTYMTYGTETALTTGYGFRFGKMALMPEVGLAHSWIHGESHTTDADNAAWDTSYGSYDEHVFKSILGARFMGTWELGGAMLTPTLGLHWEEALNDNTITVSQSLPGTSSVSVSEDVSDTSILADASLRFSRKNTSMEIALVHEYNDDYTATGGSITFRWAF